MINNSSSSFLFLILGGGGLLLLFLPILHINYVDGASIINNYIRQYCAPHAAEVSSNSNALLSSLASKAAAASVNDKEWPANFYQTDFNGSGTIYGLYLCRESDLSSVCSDCISSAKINILNLCPMAEQAIIWKENCMLRYSNHSLFSKLDDSLYSPDNQTLHDDKLIADVDMMELLNRTLDIVTALAVKPGTKNFATKEGYYKTTTTTTTTTTTPPLYSLAACTPDLTPNDCSKCLNKAREHLPVQYEGGIVLLPSCILRFGLQPFYQIASNQFPPDINSPPPPSSPPRPPGKKILKIVIAVALSTLLPAALCVFFYCWWTSARRTNNLHPVETDNDIHIATTRHGTDHDDFSTIDALQFNFGTLQYATGNFFSYSKIGEGGFGIVYKGILPDGREVAVKRPSRKLEHGEAEFKNEALVVAKLQHKNLVRLLGFCLYNDEKLLVFEFVPNHSLDYFLFDSTKQKLLNWPTRFNIIRGIARGLLYLHEESRLRIIHRDIKASNILLDEKMEPKIADFGMARMFGTDQTEDQTGRVAGTHGYIAPEYMVQGQYSVKSDVYSFGVLILEIISGKKNRSFHQTGLAQDLVIYAWELWLKGTPCELMDSTVADSKYDEVKRCIQVGLFCVDRVADNRPSMARVVHMLNMSSFDKFPALERPDFLSFGRINIDNQFGQTIAPKRRGPYQLANTSVQSSSGNNASITELLPR